MWKLLWKRLTKVIYVYHVTYIMKNGHGQMTVYRSKMVDTRIEVEKVRQFISEEVGSDAVLVNWVMLSPTLDDYEYFANTAK